MTRLTIELDDDTLERLRTKAEQLGMSVEAFVSAAAAREATVGDGVTPSFLADVDDMIETYHPVLRRLAQ